MDDVLDLRELERELEQLLDNDHISEVLRLQISEYEMLESMFPNPGELSIDDYAVIADFDDYLNGKTTIIPPQLDYTIRFNVDCHKVELCVNLPLNYPNIEPDVFVRSEGLNRAQQRALNLDLADYVSELDRGEICICLVVAWLQENANEYFIKKEEVGREVVKSPEKDKIFNRFWIYSHHIYSKVKRREILDLAHEFELTGFCLPGRPGIICIEGFASDCDDWWFKIRSMNWKKITLKKKEEVKLESGNINEYRKFGNFKELSFEGDQVKKGSYHMDFGEFHKFLSQHKCETIFKEYFGVDGK